MARSGAPCEDTPSSGLRLLNLLDRYDTDVTRHAPPNFPSNPTPGTPGKQPFQAVQTTEYLVSREEPWRFRYGMLLDRFVGYRRKSVNRVGSETACPLLPTLLLPRAPSRRAGQGALQPSRPSPTSLPPATSHYFIAPTRTGRVRSLPLSPRRQTAKWWKLRLLRRWSRASPCGPAAS